MYFLGPKPKSTIWDKTPPSCLSTLVYMSAGVSKNYKSSNRIELSQLVPALLHFY